MVPAHGTAGREASTSEAQRDPARLGVYQRVEERHFDRLQCGFLRDLKPQKTQNSTEIREEVFLIKTNTEKIKAEENREDKKDAGDWRQEDGIMRRI